MPLIKKTLETSLEEAFKQAMLEFLRVSKTSQGSDVSDTAIRAASEKFASLSSTAIDTYIRAATIVVPGVGTAVIS
jgi:hypothetical protein